MSRVEAPEQGARKRLLEPARKQKPGPVVLVSHAGGLTSTASAATRCTATQWVGAWAASPSDASRGSDISDMFDASGHLKFAFRDATARVVLTPSIAGTTARVRLSNRFGTDPATFSRAGIARRASGAALAAGSAVPLTFGGRWSVTVPAGRDVVSDPAKLTFKAFQQLAVSVYVAGDDGKPTEHYTGRQTSYLTPAGGGERVADVSGAAFTEKTTTRPFVAGVDVQARGSTGAVVAFGDSITDGYQGAAPAGVPETAEGIDADGRWPDVLARRLRAAGRSLSVLNGGISGNRVLRDGGGAGNRDTTLPTTSHGAVSTSTPSTFAATDDPCATATFRATSTPWTSTSRNSTSPPTPSGRTAMNASW